MLTIWEAEQERHPLLMEEATIMQFQEPEIVVVNSTGWPVEGLPIFPKGNHSLVRGAGCQAAGLVQAIA